jgi:hypothetical protein
MAFANLRKDSPIVRCHIQITPFMQRIVVETRPIAVNLSARDWSIHEPHDVAVAVIRAGVAILRDGSASWPIVGSRIAIQLWRAVPQIAAGTLS